MRHPVSVRIAALVATLTTLSAWLLAATEPAQPGTSAAIMALTLPAEAFVGERLVVFGSVLIRSDDTVAPRILVCHQLTGNCTASVAGNATGPAHWLGRAGEMIAHEPGTHSVTATLHAPWGVDVKRAAARAESEVTVRAPTD